MKKSFGLRRLAAKAGLVKEVKKEIKNPSAKGVTSIDKDGMIVNHDSMAAAARYLLSPAELELKRTEMGKIAKKLSKSVSNAIKTKEPFMDLSWSFTD